MSRYKADVDGTSVDLRIKLEEVHKMFTKKQLWDSYVEKNEECHDLEEQCEKLAEALERITTEVNIVKSDKEIGLNHETVGARVAREALADYEKFKNGTCGCGSSEISQNLDAKICAACGVVRSNP